MSFHLLNIYFIFFCISTILSEFLNIFYEFTTSQGKCITSFILFKTITSFNQTPLLIRGVIKKMPQRQDNAGVVYNSGIGCCFYVFDFLQYYITSCIMTMKHDISSTMYNTWWMLSRLFLKMSSFLHICASVMWRIFLLLRKILFPLLVSVVP